MSSRRVLALCFGPLLAALAVMLALPITALAAPGEVLSHTKISDTEGGWLDDDDKFGISVASLGHLNGDEVGDLAVGVWGDDDGGSNRGAVWVLFLNSDGSVNSRQKISDTEGNFTGVLDNADQFGWAVTSLGDHDGAGESVLTLAVGATLDDDGGFNRGAVWILFLNPDGTVHHDQKISDAQGNFDGPLSDDNFFGFDVASLGDLDGDGVGDLIVGAPYDDDGGFNRGAVWILFLNLDGTVKLHQKISDIEGGFTGVLDNEDLFGTSVCSLGDFDGPGGSAVTVAVGAGFDDDGDMNAGAVWLLYLNADGTVSYYRKISETEGGFTGGLDPNDLFGARGAVAPLGDLNGDGVDDIAVGAFRDDDGGANQGALWLLFLNPDGSVNSHQKISATAGNFSGDLDPGDGFGASVVSLGDSDGPGGSALTLAVGADYDDDGGTDQGAVWILYLADATTSVDPDPGLPQVLSFASSPNPFGAQTIVQYVLPTATAVRLLIHDSGGRRVATLVDRVEAAGPHSVTWDGRSDAGRKVVSGTYYCHIEAGRLQQTQSIVLTR